MRKEILGGLILTIVGIALGYVVSEYQNRPEPALVLESIDFKEIEKENIPGVSIGSDLREMAQDSKWVSLDEENIEFDKLRELVTSDLNETIQELSNLGLLVPSLLEYVEEQKNKEDAESSPAAFCLANFGELTLDYLENTIAGIVRRGEVKLQNFADYQAISVEYLLSQAYSSADNLEQVYDESMKKSLVIALKLLREWHPEDLVSVLKLVEKELAPQLSINKKIFDALQGKFEEAKKFRYQNFVNLTAAIINSGDQAITFDQYAVLFLREPKMKFFMVSDKHKGKVTVLPGSSVSFSLRSEEHLDTEELEKLQTFYSSEFMTCQLAMRLAVKKKFIPEWVHSNVAEFSGDKSKIRELYLSHASQ